MKFKRYIKNIFSIAGIRWSDGNEINPLNDGIIVSRRKITNDTERRTIADEQYLINLKNFAENVLPELLPTDAIIFLSDFLPDEESNRGVGSLPGGIPASDLNGLSTVEIFDDIFFTDYPTFADSFRSLIKNSPDNIVEIGEAASFDITASHNPGIIGSADGSPAVPVKGDAIQYVFTDWDGSETVIPATGNTQNFNGTVFNVPAGITEASCEILYGEGIGPYYNEKGREVHGYDSRRDGGSENLITSVTGRYNSFYGSGAVGSAPIDSAGVRALDSELFSEGVDVGIFDVTLAAGVPELYFFVPEGKIVEVLNTKQEFGYVTSSFVVSPIVVNDGGGNPVNYESWVLPVGGIGFLEDQSYTIRVS